ncbi:sirohydrochlorin chelatase [Paenibacillus yanchengensis]|uniref:Sirohydrochlorin chelatase n=1 Tax=Paenibacillus yanchengensis TaxID=2035833 RepID=A0ABW4YNA7_9BACL
MMRAILFIAHGSRVRESQQAVLDFFNHFYDPTLAPIQEVCFLELADPDITAGIRRCIEKGATAITAVPFLLLATGHAKRDIPVQLEQASAAYPDIAITYGQPLGVTEQMINVMMASTNHALHRHRLATVAATESDPASTVSPSENVILIVGRGSSDPDIYPYFQALKDSYLHHSPFDHVHTCFLAASQPSFEQTLSQLLAQHPKQLIILPYLLFRGVLTDHIIRTVQTMQPCYDAQTTCIIANPLADDPLLQIALRQRTIEALTTGRNIDVSSTNQSS